MNKIQIRSYAINYCMTCKRVHFIRNFFMTCNNEKVCDSLNKERDDIDKRIYITGVTASAYKDALGKIKTNPYSAPFIYSKCKEIKGYEKKEKRV